MNSSTHHVGCRTPDRRAGRHRGWRERPARVV